MTGPILLHNGGTITATEFVCAPSIPDAITIINEVMQHKCAGIATMIGPFTVREITVHKQKKKPPVRLSRQQRLENALAKEDYELAAQLRDKGKKKG